MKQFISCVTQHKKITSDYYELTFSWHGEDPLPGQFLTLNCWEESDPLLRRPFAFSHFNKEAKEVSIIYQLRGKATKRMTALAKGQSLDIIGPLGKAFPPAGLQRPLLTGGGIGTGPMVFLANWLAEKGKNPLLVLGFRNSMAVPELRLHGSVELVLTTDDGSQGFKGNVVDYMKTREDEFGDLYCCGPYPMLKGCHHWAVDKSINCYVSMEEIMACGIGACQGCAVEVITPEKYIRVCKEGPVFDSRIIKWT